jgi:hypothetical protein
MGTVKFKLVDLYSGTEDLVDVTWLDHMDENLQARFCIPTSFKHLFYGP